MLRLGSVQPLGPVVVCRIDVVGRADHPNASIDGRIEQQPGEGRLPIEAARLLGNDHVPPLGRDARPDLVDPGAAQQLAADLRLADDLDVEPVEFDATGQIVGQVAPATVDLVFGARLPLFLGGVASLDQNLGRPTDCQADGLSEVHHRAPRFRAPACLAVLACFTCPRRPPLLSVPDFVPGRGLEPRFSRRISGIFDSCRGGKPLALPFPNDHLTACRLLTEAYGASAGTPISAGFAGVAGVGFGAGWTCAFSCSGFLGVSPRSWATVGSIVSAQS